MHSLKIGFFTLCVLLYTLDETAAQTAPTMTVAASTSVAETVAAGAAVVTGVSCDAATTYTLTGTDASSFVVSDTGTVASGTAITINLASGVLLDYETKTSYSLNVVCTPTSGTDPATTTAITITVTDGNDPPVWSSGAVLGCVGTSAAANSAVVTATATDPNSGDVITYSLASTTNFAVAGSTGAVTVQSGVTLSATSGTIYVETLRAADDDGTTPYTSTATLIVCVGTCDAVTTTLCASGAATISAVVITLMLAMLAHFF